MNTFVSRANAIFAFTLSVMATLTFGCFLSCIFNDNLSAISLNTGNVVVKNVPDFTANREKTDLGFVTFDLQGDLAHLFNWNVKLLFIYLTAEYKTPSHKVNQVVLWDKIIRRGDNAVLDYNDKNTKYYFWDYGNGLLNNPNVTLTLSWNIIPNAGTLPKIKSQDKHIFEFPSTYATNRM